jgi:hypothetical protein
MLRPLWLILILALSILPAAAQAQAQATTPELGGAWGWSWGGSADSRVGRFRLDASQDLSGVISIPVERLAWGEFHYTWRSTGLTRDGTGFHEQLTDVSIHTMQIAGLRAIKPGPVQPFLLGGIGTTYFSPNESFVDIDGERYSLSSSWRLSFVIGAGAKIWLGEAQKVGLRAQIRTMPALYNSSTGLWFGSGGSSISVSGNAIWQWDVTAGISIKLGG